MAAKKKHGGGSGGKLPLVGIAVVTGAVVGGFVLEGGPLAVLFQPIELLIIGGSAVGALLIGTPPAVLSEMFKRLFIAVGIKKDPLNHIQLLELMQVLFVKAQREGYVALEGDLAKPEKSPLFSKYPGVTKTPRTLQFLVDSFQPLVDGVVQPQKIGELLDVDFDTHSHEEGRYHAVMAKVADALPGLGIVAAVLGVVITMQSVGGPPEVIGHKVAAALVGTFLGVLLCYGFAQPLVTKLEAIAEERTRALFCIRTAVVAFANGVSPKGSVEMARRVIESHDRPAYGELEAKVKAATAAAGQKKAAG